jgi:hypothetical protein
VAAAAVAVTTTSSTEADTVHQQTASCAPTREIADAQDLLLMPLDSIDLSFVDLFKEAKQEILKLLCDDKFPRWKATKEFQNFITSVRPYGSGTSTEEPQGSDQERSFNRSVVSLGTRDL